ncbi:MAG: ABC transporter permease [Lachnospiraceae bacterium]|nr:ABC transporter permease [Lachnospiraceae bacterium]
MGKSEEKRKVFLRDVPPIVWMLLVMLALFAAIANNFLSVKNLLNILRQSVPLMILAIGQTMIVLTGGTDLSLGAQVSFTTVVWILLAQAGVNIYLAAPIALLFPVGIGGINGILVSKGKVPPFIATFGMQNIVNSIALVVTSGSSLYFSHQIFRRVYESKFLLVATPIWIAVAVFAVSWILLKYTRFGTNVYGLGGNVEALSLAGVNTTGSYIKTYAFAGLLSGIAGLITACRVESGQPTVGSGWEFEAVAVTILGGTSLNTGKGGIGGTVLGVLFLNMLRNGLNISGVSAMYQNAIIGVIVMLAIVLDALMRKSRS